jgi:hypothetical protein
MLVVYSSYLLTMCHKCLKVPIDELPPVVSGSSLSDDFGRQTTLACKTDMFLVHDSSF